VGATPLYSPPPAPSPIKRLCRNQREPTSASTRNRRPGDEALERKPFIAQRWGAKPTKRNPFPRRPITHNFKRPHSKAEEPDCLFRRDPLSIMLTTQSPRGRGGYYFHGSRLINPLSPITLTWTLRFLGPSNSQKKIPCQVPRTSFSDSTKTV